MKDEIAEKAAPDPIAQNAAERIAGMHPHHRIGRRVSNFQYYNLILPIISEACRKARVDELEKQICCEPDGAPDANNVGFKYCDRCNDIFDRLSALSEPKKEETLTPKETKD